eukprot:gene8409-8593_t
MQGMIPLICQLCLQESGGGAPKAQSPTSAARREEKPWVAERWTTDKDIGDSKWNHEPRWGEDERDRERLGAGPRREAGRWKASEWGPTGTGQPRDAYAQDRWGDAPVRDPQPRDRWRADDKADKWGPPRARQLDDRFERAERLGSGRDELGGGGFGSRAGDDRLAAVKGRGFGFGRGRPAGGPLTPGERSPFDTWGSKDLDGELLEALHAKGQMQRVWGQLQDPFVTLFWQQLTQRTLFGTPLEPPTQKLAAGPELAGVPPVIGTPPMPSNPEPPKAAPWASSAPVAAAPAVKSLREIQEEEQARAAAEEAARAEAAAAAAASSSGDGDASNAAAAAGAWAAGKAAAAAAGSFAGSAAVPPGWGPPPAGGAAGASSLRDAVRAQSGSSAAEREPRLAAAASDELPAPAKKATLG